MADEIVVEAAVLGLTMREISTLLPAQLSEGRVIPPFPLPSVSKEALFLPGEGQGAALASAGRSPRNDSSIRVPLILTTIYGVSTLYQAMSQAFCMSVLSQFFSGSKEYRLFSNDTHITDETTEAQKSYHVGQGHCIQILGLP